jgi:hypothetical protein
VLRRESAALGAVAAVVGCVYATFYTAAWSFLDSHIFWPRGMLTMLTLALGWGALALRRSVSPSQTSSRIVYRFTHCPTRVSSSARMSYSRRQAARGRRGWWFSRVG